MTARSWAALLPLLALLGVAACEGGACGEDPKKPQSSSQSSSSGGGGPSHGSGDVNLSEWDSKKNPAKTDPTSAQAPPKESAPPPPSAPVEKEPKPSTGLQEVTADDWGEKIDKSKERALVLAANTPCPGCDTAASALRGLAPEFPQWRLYRLDVSVATNAAKLPKGMAQQQPPVMVMYENGKDYSRLSGMPFPRIDKETDSEYQARVTRWLRDALTQKTLSFGKPH